MTDRQLKESIELFMLRALDENAPAWDYKSATEEIFKLFRQEFVRRQNWIVIERMSANWQASFQHFRGNGQTPVEACESLVNSMIRETIEDYMRQKEKKK